MILILLLILHQVVYVASYMNTFHHWHCIDFMKNIDKSKPYAYNIGELPLVAWFNDKQNITNPLSTVNICSHMGSKLDHGSISSDGCLICPYHGLKHNEDKSFGSTMIFQDKLWWSYEPVRKLPPKIPFYHSNKFETSIISIDIDANIVDCAYNTMDVNHPAFVHNNLFGFGSNIPPSDLRTVIYKDKKKIGLGFTYKSNSNLVHLKRDLKSSQNFHVYDYPYHTWSRVSLPNNQHLIIGVDFLPLSPNKTRWFVTMKYNYWNKFLFEKTLMYFAANCILAQDKYQLSKQAAPSSLKDLVMFQSSMCNEEHFDELKKLFADYKYPDTTSVVNLYKHHKKMLGK